MLNKDERLQAVNFARNLQHLLSDPRSIAAIDVAERFAYGKATAEELEEARRAAGDAAREALAEAEALERARSLAWAAVKQAHDVVSRASRAAENASDVVEALEGAGEELDEAVTAEREAHRKAEEAEDEAGDALDTWRTTMESGEYAWRVSEAAHTALAASL